MNKTICELFAGVGGFRLGLENSSQDWNTLYANQWEPKYKTQFAYQCYVNNFGESEFHTNIDISSVKSSEIPDFNLLVGGFPCQDYSVATTGAKGIQGIKGVLWWEIHRIVSEKKPPFILLENVDRLLKSPAKQRGRDFGIILACLHNLGYSVEWRVINAADYGNAQRRRRVFIFASHNTTKYYNSLEKCNNLVDIISNIGIFGVQFPIKLIECGLEERLTHLIEDNNSVDIKEISDNYRHKFENAGIMIKGNIFTHKVEPIKETPVALKTILENSADDIFYLNEKQLKKAKEEKGAKKKERIKKDGFKYIFSEGAIPYPEPLDRPSRTMLTSEGKVSRTSHIIEDPKTKRRRFITPLECERLNGFEDNWTNTGMTNSQRYFCMGNALVVPIITRLGNYLNTIFEQES